jgi:hypothetical protein
LDFCFFQCVYGQSVQLDRPRFEFSSQGVGLTETLLGFSHEQHVKLAVAYIDRISMERPVEITLKNTTIEQALDSILGKGSGYR